MILWNITPPPPSPPRCDPHILFERDSLIKATMEFVVNIVKQPLKIPKSDSGFEAQVHLHIYQTGMTVQELSLICP